MYRLRTTQLIETAMGHAIAKNRRLRWLKSSFNSTTSLSEQPRHFASTTTTSKATLKPSTSSSNNHNTVFVHPLRALSSSSSSLLASSSSWDARILFGIVPTLLAIGIFLPDDWRSIIIGNPLMAIITGFGMLGREGYLQEDNNGETKKDENDIPRLLKNSSSSSSISSTDSMSSTEESTISIGMMNYSEDTFTIEGIQVPVGCEVNGSHLDRHGSALRCFAFFRGISVRVYVATLYSSQQFSNGSDILESSHDQPLQMDFSFLRGFTAGQCKMAWEKQLDESVSYRYDGFEEDKADFLDMIAMQSMKANGIATVQIQDDRTLIFDQGTYTGEVVGKDFQRAFLGMWFGDKPVTDELRSGLLGHE